MTKPKMKNIFKVLLATAVAFFAVLFGACGDPYESMRIVVPSESAVIEIDLGDNATAQHVFNVTVEGDDSLNKSIVASSSSEKVVASTRYIRDGINEVTLTASDVCENVLVSLKTAEGSKEETVYVSVIRAVTDISQNLSSRNNYAVIGETIELNSDLISYSPSSTSQRGVTYNLRQAVAGVTLEGSRLTIAPSYTGGNTLTLEAVSLYDPSLVTEVTLDVIGNISLQDLNVYYGSYGTGTRLDPTTVTINGTEYDSYSIANNLEGQNVIYVGYALDEETFTSTLDFRNGDVAYLMEQTYSGSNAVNTVSHRNVAGRDIVDVVVSYIDYDYSRVVASFVVDCYFTVKDINIEADGEAFTGVDITVYNSYVGVRGCELDFSVSPSGVSLENQGLTLTLGTNAADFTFYDATGGKITFVNNSYTFVAGSPIYVVANNASSRATITVTSNANPSVSKTIGLQARMGATSVETANLDTTNTVYLSTNDQNMDSFRLDFYLYPANVDTSRASVVFQDEGFEIGEITFSQGTGYQIGSVTITSASSVDMSGAFRLGFGNGVVLNIDVSIFKMLEDGGVTLDFDRQNNSAIGHYRMNITGDEYLSEQLSFYLALMTGGSTELYIRSDAQISYTFSSAQILAEGQDVYSKNYNKWFATRPENFDTLEDLTVLNSSNLSNRNVLTAMTEGKAIIMVRVTGREIDENAITGLRTAKDKVLDLYFAVEVYTPVRSLSSTPAEVNLYSRDSVGDINISDAQRLVTISLNSGSSLAPTYNKILLFLNGSQILDLSVERGEYTTDDYSITRVSNNSFSITGYTPCEFTLVASVNEDLVGLEGNLRIVSVPVHIQEAVKVAEIELLNVTEESGIYLEIPQEAYSSGATIGTVISARAWGENGSVPYNSTLYYDLIADPDSTQDFISVNRTTGAISLTVNSDTEGGTGVIRIAPADSFVSGQFVGDVAVYVPITVADGRSRATSYLITSESGLDMINRYPSLHYTLASNFDINSRLTETFSGGLYGASEGSTEIKTLTLNGANLFGSLAEGSVVEDLILIGEASGAGFVCDTNEGSIINVTVDTITASSYEASVLTASADASFVGGLVGQNSGTIESSHFYGIISANGKTVGGLAGLNAGAISLSTVEFYQYENEYSNFTGNIVAGLVGEMTGGTLETSYAFSYALETDGETKDVLDGTKNYALVGTLSGGTVNMCFAFTNASDFASDETYIENAYLYSTTYSSDNYTSIPAYPNNDSAPWTEAAGVNNDRPYFSGLLQGEATTSFALQEVVGALNKVLISGDVALFFRYTPYNAVLSNLESVAVENYNTIYLTELLSSHGEDIRVISSDSQVLATGSNYVYVNGVSDAGVTLRIFSKYDYSTAKSLTAYAMYAVQGFELYYGETQLTDNSAIDVKHGNTIVVTSRTPSSRIVINRELNFLVDDSLEVTCADKAVSGSSVGNHIINTGLYEVDPDAEENEETIKFSLGKDKAGYDALLQEQFKRTISISLFQGANKIELSTSSIVMDPMDTVTFTAYVYSDMTDAAELAKLSITSPDDISGADITYVSKYITSRYFTDSTLTEETTEANAKYYIHEYEVTLSITSDARSTDFDGRVYTVTFTTDVHTASASLELIVNTQEIISLYQNHFLLSERNFSGSQVEYVYEGAPNSNISPNNQGLLQVEVYPNFAYFDHFIVSANSSDIQLGLMQKVANKNNTYTRAISGYEVLENGSIRIGKDSKVIAKTDALTTLNIRTAIPSSVSENTNITITVMACDEEGNVLRTASYTLIVQALPKPEMTIDGESDIVLAKGDSATIDIYVNADESLDSVTISPSTSSLTLGELTIVEQEDETKRLYRAELYTSADTTTGVYTIEARVKRVFNGEQEESTDQVHVTIVDFLIESEGHEIDTPSPNKQLYEAYVGLTTDLDFVFNITDFSNASLSQDFLAQNWYVSDDESYVINPDPTTQTVAQDGQTIEKATLLDHLYYVNNFGDGADEQARVRNPYTGYITQNTFFNFILNDDMSISIRGVQSGSMNMLLALPYEYENAEGDMVTREIFFYFTITVSIVTTEDMPITIYTAEDFIDIQNSEEAHDYILMDDIHLLSYEPFANTSMINSLDGNGYEIVLESYNLDVDGQLELALFEEVSANTTLKNIRYNVCYGGRINVDTSRVTGLDLAGFALTNNGVITNCEVISRPRTDVTQIQAGGLVVSYSSGNIDVSNFSSSISGFVKTNNNAITNSRVGGTSLEVVSGDANNVRTTTYSLSPFKIYGQGNIYGFVETNGTNGKIASSFVNNIDIINESVSGEDTVTAGFVGTNSNSIKMSYVKGSYSNSTEIHTTNTGIRTSSISAGFVHTNDGLIEDCYTNVLLTTIEDSTSGRLSAGFVYQNNVDGDIYRSFSASLIASARSTQMSFSGVSLSLEPLNEGDFFNCYYYSSSLGSSEDAELEELYNSTIIRVTDVDIRDSFYGFTFSSSEQEVDGVWKMTSRGPDLVSANSIALSYRVENSDGLTNENGQVILLYADGYEYGGARNPIIIRTAGEFNRVFGGDSSYTLDSIRNFYDLSSNHVFGNYRIVNDISLESLYIDENSGIRLASTEMTLRPTYSGDTKVGLAMLDGNAFTVSGLDLVAPISTGTMRDSYGMFSSVEDGAVIMNLNLEVEGVSASGVVNVGAVTGLLYDSKLINISVARPASQEEQAEVLGQESVGAIVGRAIGNVTLSNLSADSISVTANNIRSAQDNVYSRAREGLSFAGGIVGILDYYTDVASFMYSSAESAQAYDLEVTGDYIIAGSTVGGVVGLVGPQTKVQDARLEVTGTANTQRIISYTSYAGGIVGENYGNLSMIRAEHDSTTQRAIEQNISSYYSSPSSSIYLGNSLLFGSSDLIMASPIYAGGLVGMMRSGYLERSYSKLNVYIVNNSDQVTYAGGAIGAIDDLTDSRLRSNIRLEEIYATGDVSANYVGGIVGKTAVESSISVTLSKVNALNFYTLGSNGQLRANTWDIAVSEGSGEELSTSVYSNYNGYVYAIHDILGDGTVMLSNRTQIGGEGLVDGVALDVSSLTNSAGDGYADYSREMNNIFRNSNWDQNFWNTAEGDLFPHLIFNIQPAVIYIDTAADLERILDNLGSTFVVRALGNTNNSGIIDLTSFLDNDRPGFQIRGFYGYLRNYDDTKVYGFSYNGATYTRALFDSTLTGAQISNLTFESFRGPLINNAVNTTLSTLTFNTFTRTYTVTSADSSSNAENVGAIINSLTGSTVENITINGASLSVSGASSESLSAGLFAGSVRSSSLTNILLSGNNNSLTIAPSSDSYGNTTPITLNSLNVGGLAGQIVGDGSTQSVSLNSSTLNLTLTVSPDVQATDARIGGIVGYTSAGLTVSGGSLNLSLAVGSDAENPNSSRTIKLGGVAGQTSALMVNDGFELNIGANIFQGDDEDGEDRDLYFGGIVGQATGNVSLDSLDDLEGNVTISTTGLSYTSGLVASNEGGELTVGSDGGRVTTNFSFTISANLNNSIYGGAVAHNAQALTISNYTALDEVEVSGSSDPNFAFGGVVGAFDEGADDSYTASIQNANWGGHVAFNANTQEESGETTLGTFDNVYAGGILGDGAMNSDATDYSGSWLSSGSIISNCFAYGDIDFESSVSGNLRLGGIAGRGTANLVIGGSLANYSLATLYYPYEQTNKSVGAIVGAPNGLPLSSQNNNYYSSMVTLATEDYFADTNMTYADILNEKKDENQDSGHKLNPSTNYPGDDIASTLNRVYICFDADTAISNTLFSGHADRKIAFIGNGETYSFVNPKALFDTITAGSFVSGLNLDLGTGVTLGGTSQYRGALAEINNGFVFNISAVGSLTASSSYVAGLVGSNNGYIGDSFTSVDVTNTSSQGTSAGFALGSGVIENCYSTGAVSGLTTYSFGSGSAIRYCYAIGRSYGENEKRVFDGANNTCFYDAYGTEAVDPTGSNNNPQMKFTNDISAFRERYLGKENYTSVTPSDSVTNTSKYSYDYTKNYGYQSFTGPAYNSKDESGAYYYNFMSLNTGYGTETEPIEIPNLGKLAQLNSSYTTPSSSGSGNTTTYPLLASGVYFRQTYDFDFTTLRANTSTNNGIISSWTPIGGNDNRFQGVYDGNNKVITGLTYNQYSYRAGLFRYTENATIANLSLSNVNITAKYDGDTTIRVGAIVAQSQSTIITNCHVLSGNISSGEDVVASVYMGGIVGQARLSTITRCSNSATINAAGGAESAEEKTYYVGGIVGYTYNTTSYVTTISQCYNTGAITAGNSTNVDEAYAAGISGYRGQIDNCYNTGSITGQATLQIRYQSLYYYTRTSVEVIGGDKFTFTLLRTTIEVNISNAYASGISNEATVDKSYNTGTILGNEPGSRGFSTLVESIENLDQFKSSTRFYVYTFTRLWSESHNPPNLDFNDWITGEWRDNTTANVPLVNTYIERFFNSIINEEPIDLNGHLFLSYEKSQDLPTPGGYLISKAQEDNNFERNFEAAKFDSSQLSQDVMESIEQVSHSYTAPIGYNSSVTDSYYLKGCLPSGWIAETGVNDGGEAKTASEMRSESTYADWDFNSIWKIESFAGAGSRYNSGYPFLRQNLPYIDLLSYAIQQNDQTGGSYILALSDYDDSQALTFTMGNVTIDDIEYQSYNWQMTQNLIQHFLVMDNGWVDNGYDISLGTMIGRYLSQRGSDGNWTVKETNDSLNQLVISKSETEIKVIPPNYCTYYIFNADEWQVNETTGKLELR